MTPMGWHQVQFAQSPSVPRPGRAELHCCQKKPHTTPRQSLRVAATGLSECAYTPAPRAGPGARRGLRGADRCKNPSRTACMRAAPRRTSWQRRPCSTPTVILTATGNCRRSARHTRPWPLRRFCRWRRRRPPAGPASASGHATRCCACSTQCAAGPSAAR